jgi:hypothetical protein
MLAGQSGWKAAVKSDGVPVYAGMSSSSRLVKSLNKGAAVLIETDLATAQGHWCSIREPGSAARTGYVLCDNLEREKAASTSSAVARAAPPSKEAITECKPRWIRPWSYRVPTQKSASYPPSFKCN